MPRTPEVIVNQTNEIARIIYRSRGYETPVGFEFQDTGRVNRHPYEEQCWDAACEIQILLTNTDPQDALDELED